MAKKESTLRCVTVLVVIAVVCGVLLAVLNPLLYVAPSADDIAKQFDVVDLDDYNATNGTAVEWAREETNVDFAGGGQDQAQVSLVAKLTLDDQTYVGLLIKTRASGDLGECQYAMFFTQSDNKLILAKIAKDGATAGKTFEYAIANKKGDLKLFEDYYVIIDSATVFDDGYKVPTCGATKTATSVDNAFKRAAYYYYNVYANGGEVNEG